jgi:ABC-type transport system involved in multi-copper enzyme maturation permease subunit
MIRSFRSEWIKLRRPGMILGGAGTIVGFAILTVVLTLTTASATPTDEGGPGGEGLTLAQLAATDGLAAILATAATFIGVVALSVFAISIASEYSQGTLRNLLVRQPRRVRLLAGKLLALASFTTLAVVVAGIAAVATALLVAPTQDISTAAWFTSAGWTALAGGLGNLLLATLGWGLLGALLALVLRTPAAAVGVGLAYALPGELLLTTAWSDGARWLPGQLLDALAQGGTAAVTYGSAGLLLALYGVVAMVAGTTLFARRDVAT